MKTTSKQTALNTLEFSKNHKKHKITITTYDTGSESNSELGSRSCTFEADLNTQEVQEILSLVSETFKEE